MHIYNVTINIDESVHDEWIDWMKTEHIPEMLATGKFTEALMSRVLVEEEMGGITYSVQYQTKDMETLQRYYQEDAEEMRAKSKRFEGKAVAFRTEMEIIDKQ
ncbi:MAG TPA: DUF4286 family protein [Flavobacteriaceae bacterium]|nr:DUF4286 family protein [Flavobacteriaceae bacterium]